MSAGLVRSDGQPGATSGGFAGGKASELAAAGVVGCSGQQLLGPLRQPAEGGCEADIRLPLPARGVASRSVSCRTVCGAPAGPSALAVIAGKSQPRFMGAVSAYWRPVTVEGALALLHRAGAVLIGGGTKVNAAPSGSPVEIVDLQALGLDRIEATPTGYSVGATATLQQIATGMVLPGAVRDAARREAPSTLRSAATIGGCVATGDWESEFLATLLACDATVTLARSQGAQELGLDELLADHQSLRGAIITRVCIAGDGIVGAARTGRTAADKPIVCAVARYTAGGVRLALSGVAARPVLNRTALIRSGADAAAWAARLDPPSDFRGSSAYRRALAVTLARRAVEAIT